MNNKTFYVNENLRSISAIIAAQNNQKNVKKLSVFGEYSRQSKISKQPVNSIKIHRSSSPWNHNSKKEILQRNKIVVTKTKKSILRSSKVAPDNNNVFYFNDGSDLTMSDILSNRYGPTKETRRSTEQMKAKRRWKCIGIFICLFAILAIGIIITVVVVTLLFPS